MLRGKPIFQLVFGLLLNLKQDALQCQHCLCFCSLPTNHFRNTCLTSMLLLQHFHTSVPLIDCNHRVMSCPTLTWISLWHYGKWGGRVNAGLFSETAGGLERVRLSERLLGKHTTQSAQHSALMLINMAAKSLKLSGIFKQERKKFLFCFLRLNFKSNI